MAGEPGEEAIQNFIELSNLTRSNALRWLKAHNNDANNAAVAWFDGGCAELPPPPKYNESYMEHQFHADRDGNQPQSQLEASFGTDGAGALDPSTFSDSIPPTRPSSRVSNTKLPMYGPENNPNLGREETYEQQIQRAKEMSLSESQTLPAQEMGVTYANPYFGPATQRQYDSEKWALTVTEAQTQEILLNPAPPDRRRQLGAPAFVKPSSSSHYLPAFIKILHAIPMAREALLNRTYLLGDYGQDNEWWDGTTIRGLRVVNVDEDDQNAPLDDLICETQRLMAFLDDTKRAYGSAEPLAGMSSLIKHPDGVAAAFLESWRNATQRQVEEASLSDIFSSRGTRRAKSSEQVDQYEPFCCLPVRIDSTLADKGFSLYEAIDDMVWSTSDGFDVFLDQLGDIMTFEPVNLSEHSHVLGISIPPVWYADRYLESSVGVAAQMQADKEAIVVSAREIDNIQTLMMSFRKRGTQTTMDVGPLMTKVTNYFRQTAEYRDLSEGVEPQDPKAPSQSIGPIIQELSVLAKRVTEKLSNFQDIRDSVSEHIMQASNKFKVPSDEPSTSPTHKYFLKGVISKPHAFYVLEAAPLIDEDEELHSPSVPGQQWWEIDYDSTSASPVSMTKVAEHQVLNAASFDAPRAVLVYASERAMSFERKPLPPQLQTFVRSDNLAFDLELHTYQTQNASSGLGFSSSPQKRKAAEGANDSDMEVEPDNSPKMDPYRDFNSSDSSPLETNPPDADDDYVSGPAPTPPTRLRSLQPKPPVAVSSDDYIPVSLRQKDHEMQESGDGLLKGFAGKYKFGSYTPELKMDDNDEGYEEGEVCEEATKH